LKSDKPFSTSPGKQQSIIAGNDWYLKDSPEDVWLVARGWEDKTPATL